MTRLRSTEGRRASARQSVLLLSVALVAACSGDGDAGEDARLDERLAVRSTVAAREGLAAAILIDVSGSMADQVLNESGGREAKIDVARRAGRDLVDQFARYAADHADEPVMLGVYEFSALPGKPDCRTIVPMGPPNVAQAQSALAQINADGDTPIGNAMITVKHELDATGLTRRHLLVVTDGENTRGADPGGVAVAIGRRPEAERPSIYFVAFDIAESRFASVRDAGGLVLAASNARELNDTLDSLLRGKILVEK
jgi:Mg-chelatase subunit ChlD